MSESIRVCIQNDKDIIKTAADIMAEKLDDIVYQTYHQLNPRGQMTIDDFNHIRDLIVNELCTREVTLTQ